MRNFIFHNPVKIYFGEGQAVHVTEEAVVYGTANARRLLDSIKRGEKFYQFIEVMTCPGGCFGGGGQPKDKNFSGDGLRQKRIDGLYARDRQMKLRLSHENPEIKAIYKNFYEKPLPGLFVRGYFPLDKTGAAIYIKHTNGMYIKEGPPWPATNTRRRR